MTLEPYTGRIANAYGLGTPRGAMMLAAQGEQGLVWRLETDLGEYAVKELLVRQSEPATATEVAFQDAAADLASFTLPRTIRTVSGAVLAEFDQFQVRVQSWVDIHPLDIRLDPVKVGRLLADLHSVGEPTTDAVDPWYFEAVGQEQWEHYRDELERRQSPVASVIAEALPDLVELEAVLAAPTALRRCHRDLWAENVRATPTGELCVIDWDNSGPADPGQELGMVLWEFSADDDDRCRALYDSYRAAGGPGRIIEAGSFTMLVAQFGHFYEAALDVWIDPDSTPEDFEWSRGRLDELASRPLSMACIDHLLRAVSSDS